MNAFYWVGEISNEKYITVFRGEKRKCLEGNEVIAEFTINGFFHKLKLKNDKTGSEKDLLQAIYTARQLLKFLKKEKVI